MAALQSVAKRDSMRTSYKVLKMNEDTHVTPRTATELGQRQELANPVKPHQNEKPCSLINHIKYICKAIKTKFLQDLTDKLSRYNKDQYCH